MELVLLSFGIGFAVLFLLINLVQAARGAARVNFWTTLLGFLVALVPLLAVVNNRMSAAPSSFIDTAALATGGAVAIVSVVILLLERRHATKAKDSRGLLGLGAGALLVSVTLAMPLILSALPAPQLVEAAPLAIVPTNAARVEVVAQAEVPAANTPQAAPTATRVPAQIPTLPVLPTRVSRNAARADATAEADSADAEAVTTDVACQGVVTNNLNLRGGASMNSDIIVTIPYNSGVTVEGADASGAWLRVTYRAESGWVSAQYVTLGAACGDLPEVDM